MYTVGLRIAAMAAVLVAALATTTYNETELTPVATTAVPEAVTTTEAPKIRETLIYGETPELEALGRRAVELFGSLGMELPVLDLYVYENPDPCRRRDGTFRSGVTIMGADSYTVLTCGSVFTLMHELAHAWEHHAMAETTRAALLELRGLETWSHEEWDRAGGEHLASIIAWGLTGERPKMISTGIDDASLAEAYELATGSPAPTLEERGLALIDGHVRRVVS